MFRYYRIRGFHLESGKFFRRVKKCFKTSLRPRVKNGVERAPVVLRSRPRAPNVVRISFSGKIRMNRSGDVPRSVAASADPASAKSV